MSALLRALAARHRLRIHRGDDSEPEILGRAGAIYEHGPERLAVMVQVTTPRRWNSRRRAMVKAGMVCLQDGDCEGCVAFNPLNAEHVTLAIRFARVKPRRVLSEAQALVLARARGSSPIMRQGPASAQGSSRGAGMAGRDRAHA